MHISAQKTKKRDNVHMLTRPNRGDMRSRRQFWPVRAVSSDSARNRKRRRDPTTRPRLVSSSSRRPMERRQGPIAGHRPAGDAPCPILPTTISIQHMVCPDFSMEQNAAANQIEEPERLGFRAESLDCSSSHCQKCQASTSGLKNATRRDRESELGRNPIQVIGYRRPSLQFAA